MNSVNTKYQIPLNFYNRPVNHLFKNSVNFKTKILAHIPLPSCLLVVPKVKFPMSISTLSQLQYPAVYLPQPQYGRPNNCRFYVSNFMSHILLYFLWLLLGRHFFINNLRNSFNLRIGTSVSLIHRSSLLVSDWLLNVKNSLSWVDKLIYCT